MFILRVLKYLLILVVFLFFIVQIKFMPSYATKLMYKGNKIEIKRDIDFNIPTIWGDSKLAALYGLGYVTAEDRLFQMHIKRMVGKGRLSEIVGEKGVNLDILFRELGVGVISKQGSENMRIEDPEAYQGYQAYADGVNDYVKKSGLSIQFYFLWTDFQQWQVVDTFIVTKLVDWVQSHDGGLTVLRQLLAQKVGKDLAQKMLGWKQQHFLLPNQPLIVNKQQLKFSSQLRGEQNNLITQQIPVFQTHQSQNQQYQQVKLKAIVQQQLIVQENNDNNNLQQNQQQEEQQQQNEHTDQAQKINEYINSQQFNQENDQIGKQQGKQQLISQQQANQPVEQQQQQQTTPKQYIEQQYQIQQQIKQQKQQNHEEEQYGGNIGEKQSQQEANIDETQQLINIYIERERQQKNQQQNYNNLGQNTYQENFKQDTVEDNQILKDNQIVQQDIINSIRDNKVEQIDQQLLNFVNGGGGASNSWVISGEHTTSGRPHLANDPHLAAVIPSQWYQAEIRYPHSGKQVYLKGVFIAGSSLSSILGKTQYLAWGCTTENKDTQDLYRERVQGNRYFVDGQWRNLEQRHEIIRVKNGNDIPLTISKTHRGPLLTKIIYSEKLLTLTGNVSFAWTGLNTKHSFLSYLHNIAELNSLDQTANFFSEMDDGPAMNLVYITNDDHIGYSTISGVPRRKAKQTPYYFDGTTTQNDWDGLVHKSQKLSLRDPPKGFIVTANSRASDSNFKGSTIYDSNFLMTSRHMRLDKLLQNQINSGRKFTIQDSINYQLDEVDQYCLHILPSLKNIDSRFEHMFSRWECTFEATSYQASIYQAFFLKLQFKIQPFKQIHVYGFPHFNHYTYIYIVQAATNQDPYKIKQISQSLSQGLQMLKTKFNTETFQKWQWGILHATYYSHLPFSNSPLKSIFNRHHISGGSLNTPRMGKMTKLNQQNFNCQHHASLRMILTFVPNQSQWVIDTGQSSYPFSNYYDDQQLLHKDGKYIKFDTQDLNIIEEL